MTVTVILWKSDNPVSITPELWKLKGLFVKIKSMQQGFWGFLWQVGTLIRFFNPEASQNVSICESSGLTLKSPVKMIFSYFAEYKSKLFLNRCKWFEMLFLLGLYEQLRSRFFFRKFSSIRVLQWVYPRKTKMWL